MQVVSVRLMMIVYNDDSV